MNLPCRPRLAAMNSECAGQSRLLAGTARSRLRDVVRDRRRRSGDSDCRLHRAGPWAASCGPSGIFKEHEPTQECARGRLSAWRSGRATIKILLPRRSMAHHSPPLRVQLTPRSNALTSSNRASDHLPAGGIDEAPHWSRARTGANPNLKPKATSLFDCAGLALTHDDGDAIFERAN